MRIPAILATIILLSGCYRPHLPDQVKNDLDSIAARWVPDQREGICTWSAEMLKDRNLVIRGETNLETAKDDIMSYLDHEGFAVIDSLKVLPDQNEIDKPWGLVRVSVCNIKSDPSYSSELVSQAVMGTPVKLLKTRGSWILIQMPDYYLGWITGSSIIKLSEEEMQAWKKSDRLIYTGRSGDIVSESKTTETVSDITTGAIVKLISGKQDFYMVELPDSREGLIQRNQVKDFKIWRESIKPDAEKLIDYAKTFIGYPYMWGGTSTKAFDCSGFVKTVFFTGGIILARDASLQYLHGEPVDISSSYDSLVPGDLIFFGYFNDRGEEKIIHVGLYIGDTEVIHASGMVNINSLDPERGNYSSYLGETIKGARRVIGEESQKGIESVANHPWYNDR